MRPGLLIVSVVAALSLGRAVTMPESSCEPGVLCRSFDRISGHAYRYALMAPQVFADEGAEQRSSLIVYEDGRALGPAHSGLSDITEKGAGRYIYYRSSMATTLYLSTSDNSDPNTNGRRYTWSDPGAVDPYKR